MTTLSLFPLKYSLTYSPDPKGANKVIRWIICISDHLEKLSQSSLLAPDDLSSAYDELFRLWKETTRSRPFSEEQPRGENL